MQFDLQMEKPIWILALCLLPLMDKGAAACAIAIEQTEPRIVLGLYDGRREPSPADTRLHRFLEFPLNHLGYSMRYIDVSKFQLPNLDDPEIAGLASWFDGDLPDPHAYAKWLSGKPDCAATSLIVLGETGLQPNQKPDREEEDYLADLGLRWTARSVLLGDFTEVAPVDKSLIGYETDFVFKPGRYASLRAISPEESFLRVAPAGKPAEDSIDLVVFHQANAYVHANAALDGDNRASGQYWILNPFAMLQRSLSRTVHPIPDVTTLNGRRIYFEVVGPEGWLTPAPARTFDEELQLGSENLFDLLIAPFPDVPLTVSVVTGDLDPAIGGKPAETGREVADKIFAETQTAIATSGRSLVRVWGAVRDQAEIPLTAEASTAIASADQTNHLLTVLGKNLREAFADPHAPAEPELSDGVRQYGQTPLSLDEELAKPLAFAATLAPDKTAPALFVWSGDGKPPEQARAAVAAAGVGALGGGRIQLGQTGSISDLTPFGLSDGGPLQVYHALPGDLADLGYPSPNAHYLHDLSLLIAATDRPVRLKPFELAYSAGTANQFGTRSAIEQMKRMAAVADVIPIFAARYAAIVEGFSTVRFQKLGRYQWQISERGSLQTIRFDQTDGLSLDLTHSTGVLGARRSNGSLYVALDPRYITPIVTLAVGHSKSAMVLPAGAIGLRDSNLEVVSVKRQACQTTMTMTGWGAGSLSFYGDPDTPFRIRATSQTEVEETLVDLQVQTDADGLVSASLPTLRGKPEMVAISQQCAG